MSQGGGWEEEVFQKKQWGAGVRRWDVSGLLGRNEDDCGRETIRGSFLREVREKIVEVWDESHDVEVKWSNLK